MQGDCSVRLCGIAIYDLLLHTLETAANIAPTQQPHSTAPLQHGTAFAASSRTSAAAAAAGTVAAPRDQRNTAHTALQCMAALHKVGNRDALALECYIKSALVLRDAAPDDDALADVLTVQNFRSGAIPPLHGLAQVSCICIAACSIIDLHSNCTAVSAARTAAAQIAAAQIAAQPHHDATHIPCDSWSQAKPLKPRVKVEAVLAMRRASGRPDRVCLSLSMTQ